MPITFKTDEGRKVEWYSISELDPINYKCGYCEKDISSYKGYFSDVLGHIYLCHNCGKPSYCLEDDFTPSPSFGRKVDHITDGDCETLYDEARNCIKLKAYTASVMCCRKLLIHLAKENGASDEQISNFTGAVNYLSNNHYVPPGANKFLEQIRKLGNEANHEIALMSEKDAKLLIYFLELILSFMYEAEGKLASHSVEDAPSPLEES